MPPRAPTVWTTAATRGERVRRRLDERHGDLTREAKSSAGRYRASRTARSSVEAKRLRADLLAALGRLAAFEAASLRLMSCRYDVQIAAHADALSRDYFELWQLIARRGLEQRSEDERAAERLDHFAVQLGRLEGMADALLIAGRNVRLFPPPQTSWAPLDRGRDP